MNPIFKKKLRDLATSLRDGVISAESLARAAIDNHRRHADSFSAYRCWAPDAMVQQARVADAALAAGIDSGPLLGMPVSVKDLYGVRGYSTFAGTPRRLPKAWEIEGPVVSSLRRQLAVVTGKTHTVEFAFGGLGVNPHWDTPRNPWDREEHRVPGGSSSGAGVSLGAGSAVLALGSDTAGSVRIPASMTGNVGVKTSYRRWSCSGIVPLSPSLDTPGILARNVEDAAFGFSALDSAENRRNGNSGSIERADLSGLRFAISDGLLWEDCSPGVYEAVKRALDALTAKGVSLVSEPLPEAEQVFPVFLQGGLAAVELYAFLQTELADWVPHLDEKIAQRMEDASTLPAYTYLQRVRLFERLAQQADQRLRSLDVLITPTVPITPPTLKEIENLEDYKRANMLSLRNTAIVNYLGLCAVTIPVGLDSCGMPVGMQLIARRGQDVRLLAIALACERVLGDASERLGEPPLTRG